MATVQADSFGWTAITLHWVVAALIVANLLLGLSMVAMPISPAKLQSYITHKTIGITVFLLAGVRLAWRMARGAPAPVAMPLWQRKAAATVQALMYALLLLIPVSGWIYSSSTGVQVVYLGAFPLPDLVNKDRELATVLKGVHVGFNVTLVTLVVLHAAAALKHHFVDRDRTLTRMLPFAKPRGAA
jgi:cytochrome b561